MHLRGGRVEVPAIFGLQTFAAGKACVGNGVRQFGDLVIDRVGHRFALVSSDDNRHTLQIGRITRNGLREIQAIESVKGAEHVAFTANGNRLIVGHADDTVVIYDLPAPAAE